MIKVFLLTTFLTISSVFNSFDSKPNIALDCDFEDKIVFNYSPTVGVYNKGRISICNMALYTIG